MFISMHYMELGGAEISLIGLLQTIDYSRYDVDLMIYSHQGELMGAIPKEVNLLKEIPQYAQIEYGIRQNVQSGYWSIAWAKLRAKAKHRLYKMKHPSEKEDYSYQQYMIRELLPSLPSLHNKGEYDLAISFMHPHNIVLEKVKARKKVCWIHTDYSVVAVNKEMELPVWSAFDHVISISPDVTRNFLKVFPSLNEKVVEIENILSSEFVCQRADLVSQTEIEKEMPRVEGVVRFLSIGRFCEAKNYDNIPDICNRINSKFKIQNSKLEIKWYIIGWGSDEALIRQKIAEARMESQVVLFGKKTNPYPYIKACDIYVQPSRYEGKSVTVREAQMLCKPVVVTNYPTASSQIKDGIDGRIVSLDNEGCAKGLAEFILDKESQSKIVNYLQNHDYGNEGEIEKLYKLIP